NVGLNTGVAAKYRAVASQSEETPIPAADAGDETIATRTAAAVAEATNDAAGGGDAVAKRAAASSTAATDAATIATPNAAADDEPGRNQWGSGLANTKRAADLKALLSKRSKVLSVRFSIIDEMPSAHSFRFRTMSIAEEADCIQLWHHTKLTATMIFVERTRHEPNAERGAAAWAAAKTQDVVKRDSEATSSSEGGNIWGILDNHPITILVHISPEGDKTQQRGPLRMRQDRYMVHNLARRAVKGKLPANCREVRVCARRAVRRGQG
ncbi:scaffold attachment factor B2-like, partial [Rhipicephalus sanguineus]|uniref:scaffold attachment factor B2-like n=1 Tax=Rhipicephalus sanguineus TaxID=34632 RepID=UPI001894A1C8